MNRLGLLGLAGLAAGCAALPERGPPADLRQAWRTHSAELRSIDRWELRGRLGLRAGERSGQATLVWRRDHDTHRIDLFGPLGGGRVLLVKDPFGAELRDAKKRTYTADNVRELLYDTTGWEVPFDELTYWLIGLPAPGVPRRLRLDARGRLAVLHQDGWRIRFIEYRRHGTLELPRKVFLEREADARSAAPEDVQIRLVIKYWGIEL